MAAQDLGRVISAGDAAFGALDAQAFRAADSEAARLLPCLDEALEPAQVAALHRLHALAAFLARDHAGAVSAFRSMLATAPDYRLSEEAGAAQPPAPHRLPGGGRDGLGAGAPLRAPRQGWVQVDGQRAEQAPADRPWVFQHFSEDGQVLGTSLVPVGGETPAYPSRSRGGSGARVPLGSPPVWPQRHREPFLLAQSSEQAFWDPSTPTGDLQGLRDQTNTFGWLSAGAGVVAAGAGAGAVLSGSF